MSFSGSITNLRDVALPGELVQIEINPVAHEVLLNQPTAGCKEYGQITCKQMRKLSTASGLIFSFAIAFIEFSSANVNARCGTVQTLEIGR